MTKRITSLLLLCAMLTSMVACGQGASDETSAEMNADTTVVEETEDVIADNLPERDFEGKTFTSLIPAWTAGLMAAEELNGEVLNDALYNRDRTVEARFNTTIVSHIVDDCAVEMKNVTAAGDDLYQIASDGIVSLGINLMQDWYLNAREIPYLNFEQPWYPSEVTKELTYKDVTFIFISDYSIASMDMTDCLFWNRDLANEYNLEDIYDVVREGKWTKDKMEEMCLGVYQDVNGDGTKDDGDRYGIALDFKGDPSTITFSFGHRVLQRQDDGTFKDVFYDEALVDQVEWMYNLTHNEEAVNCQDKWNHGYNMFMLGNTLTGYARINMVSWGMRDSEIDYAIIPRPMYDENQEKYLSTLAGSADAMVFLKTLGDREFAGIILEALAAESYRTCVTAYYDNVLSYKLVRDEGNMEMIELIMDGRMYDFGYVYGAFESHGGGASFWINDIVKGNGDLTSYYQKRKSNWENYMATVLSKFENYQG